MVKEFITFRSLRVTGLLLLLLAASGCSKQPAETKETQLSRADAALAAGQYAAAEKAYREVLSSTPNEPKALRQLAVIYFDQGQLLQAIPLLKQAADQQPNDLELQFKFGTSLLALRQFTEAREIATRILDQKPGHQEALALLADTATSISDVTEIRKAIEARRSADQDGAGYHVALGLLDLKQNNVASAEREFKAAIETDRKSTVAHAALANLYWSQNNQKAAEQEFAKAAELAPERPALRVRYAEFLQRTGSSDQAKPILEEIATKMPEYLPAQVQLMRMACVKPTEEDCTTRVQRVLARDPINYDALLLDGMANLRNGDTAKAIRQFEQLSSTYSRSAQARYQLALAYRQYAQSAEGETRRKATESAESSLTTAVNLDPKLQGAVLVLSAMKIEKGSPAAAVDLLEPLVKDNPKLPQASYLLASAYLAQQNTDKALAIYRHMADEFPQDPQPSFLIGSILLAQQQLPAARSALEKSVSISPSLPAIERLVDLDIAERNFAAATARIQAQIDRDPKVAPAWAIRGKISVAQRDLAKAEPDLLKAIELDPNFEAAYQLLAQVYLASNKPEQAVEKLKNFVEKKKTVPALITLAGIQERMKNFPASRDSYEQALALNPNLAPALNNLSVLYSEQLGDPQKGYDLAKKARDANPNEPHIADTFGWALFKRGQYAEALRVLQESAARLPQNAEVQFHLGSAQYMTGQEALALASLKKAIEIGDFPGKDVATKRISVLSIDTAAPISQSRPALEAFLREQPNDPVALFKLADLQNRDGAPDDAIKTYDKLLAADPYFTPALQRLAILYGQKSVDDPKAFDVAQKAYQAYPDDPEVTKALGILNYRRDYYARAADLLKQAAAKRADDAEIIYYLGAAQHQLKQWPDCKATFERATNLNLPPALAEKAKGFLAACTENAA